MKVICIKATALSLAVGALSAGLSLLLVTQPVLALDADEAEAVVGIMEVLTMEMGEGMSTDAAAIFYDYDSLGEALIPAAGFDRAQWIEAYDAVAAGYMATIPQDEFNAVFEEPLALLEASELPDDQKAMMREHMDGLIAQAQAVRLSGMDHADVIRPLEDRLYPMFFGAFEE